MTGDDDFLEAYVRKLYRVEVEKKSQSELRLLGSGGSFVPYSPPWYPEQVMGKITYDDRGGPYLMHEVVHAWLSFKKEYGFITLSAVKDLDRQVKERDNRYLDDLVFRAYKQENMDPQCFRFLQNVLGAPENTRATNLEIGVRMVAPTVFGNLVDESAAVMNDGSRLLDEGGHPMGNFGEFLASFITTTAYADRNSVLDKLAALKSAMATVDKSSAEYASLSKIYSCTSNLLQFCVSMSKEMIEDLKEFSKTPGQPAAFSRLALLEKRIAEIEAFVNKEKSFVRARH
ncbi:MAG: hypothetical protein WC717_01480 [Candidatus Micrarchaeia archaeon]|jgi:hypothetical protein